MAGRMNERESGGLRIFRFRAPSIGNSGRPGTPPAKPFLNQVIRHVNCNLCGADNFDVLFEKSRRLAHRVVRCKHCGLMYANPQEWVDCLQMGGAGWAGTFEPDGDDRAYFQKVNAQLADYAKALDVLNEYCPHKGRLLEIGCGPGLLLAHARSQGWDVVGLEPDPRFANYARAHYGFELIEALLPQARAPDGAFDAVLLLHVIEHMPDPLADLREARRLLKPGGMLVVETPRFDSFMFKLLGKRERSLNNWPGHIYFFTVPTLRRLLKIAGFEVVRTDLVGRTLTVQRLLFNAALVVHGRRLEAHIARLGRLLHLDNLRVHINLRDMQRVYARTIHREV